MHLAVAGGEGGAGPIKMHETQKRGRTTPIEAALGSASSCRVCESGRNAAVMQDANRSRAIFRPASVAMSACVEPLWRRAKSGFGKEEHEVNLSSETGPDRCELR